MRLFNQKSLTEFLLEELHKSVQDSPEEKEFNESRNQIDTHSSDALNKVLDLAVAMPENKRIQFLTQRPNRNKQADVLTTLINHCILCSDNNTEKAMKQHAAFMNIFKRLLNNEAVILAMSAAHPDLLSTVAKAQDAVLLMELLQQNFPLPTNAKKSDELLIDFLMPSGTSIWNHLQLITKEFDDMDEASSDDEADLPELNTLNKFFAPIDMQIQKILDVIDILISKGINPSYQAAEKMTALRGAMMAIPFYVMQASIRPIRSLSEKNSGDLPDFYELLKDEEILQKAFLVFEHLYNKHKATFATHPAEELHYFIEQSMRFMQQIMGINNERKYTRSFAPYNYATDEAKLDSSADDSDYELNSPDLLKNFLIHAMIDSFGMLLQQPILALTPPARFPVDAENNTVFHRWLLELKQAPASIHLASILQFLPNLESSYPGIIEQKNIAGETIWSLVPAMFKATLKEDITKTHTQLELKNLRSSHAMLEKRVKTLEQNMREMMSCLNSMAKANPADSKEESPNYSTTLFRRPS